MRKCLSASPVRQGLPAGPLNAQNVPDFRDNQGFCLKISQTSAIMREIRQKTRGKFAKIAKFSLADQPHAGSCVRPKNRNSDMRSIIEHLPII
jgi:hypothetical protein